MDLATGIDDATTIAMARFNLGYASLSAGDYVRARKEIQDIAMVVASSIPVARSTAASKSEQART